MPQHVADWHKADVCDVCFQVCFQG